MNLMVLRSAIALLLAAACAHTGARQVIGPAALQGCWEERTPGQVITKRWSPDAAGTLRSNHSVQPPLARPEPAEWFETSDAGASLNHCTDRIPGFPAWCVPAVVSPAPPPQDAVAWTEFQIKGNTLEIVQAQRGGGVTVLNGVRKTCD